MLSKGFPTRLPTVILTHNSLWRTGANVASDVLVNNVSDNGPLARYVKLRVVHAQGMPETFSPPLQISYPDMHHRTCITHVPWCMPGSLKSGFLWSWWRGKRSRHSRRMRNPKFYVSGKRPMAFHLLVTESLLDQCRLIDNWPPKNKLYSLLQWNWNWSILTFIQENAFEMSSAKCRSFCLCLSGLH